MEIIKKAVVYAGIGIAIGSVASTVSMACIGGVDGTLKQVLVWQVVSAFFGLATWIMYADFGNLLIRTILHFVLCFVIAVTTGTVLEYYGGWFQCAIGMFLPFILIYMVIYAVIFGVTSVEVKRMNQKLKNNT